MGASNIGSSKYPLAKIPAMADPADIQVALKYYHWGQEAEPEGTATAGISKYLDDIDTRIDEIDTTLLNVIEDTIVDAKGDLIVGFLTNTASVTNKVLTSNVATLTTSTNHNFIVGDKVIVTGVDSTFNGTYTVTAKTNTTVSYAKTASNVPSAAVSPAGQIQETSVDNLTVGSDGHYLVADSAQTLGVKWAALPLNSTLTSTSTSEAATASTVKTLQDTKAPLNFSTNAQTGTTYSLVKSDNGYIIEMNNASANTLTIPLNSDTNGDFTVGSQVTVIQTGSGQTTINVTAGVTLNCTPQGTANTAKLRAQWSSCTLIKRAENTWIAVGDLVA